MKTFLKQIFELCQVKNLCAVLFLFLASVPLADAAFTDLGAGARATGMGNSFVAIADDVFAVHYNPAGLPLLTQPELATAYTKHLMGLSDGSNLSTSFVGYAQPLGGALGTAALSWQQFSLNGGLYRDQAMSLSYGNKIFKDLGPGNLFAGLNLKMLNRSFGVTPEASNAMDGLLATGQADPLLSGKRSVSALDIDLGFLYRMYEKYSVGLSLGHVTQPNVAFDPNATDTLPLSVKLGVNRRSLLGNVGVQYETRRGPVAARDQRLSIALERWFPWLLVGNVGARAALTMGNREFQQVSAGASYKNRQISVDYSFSLPLNSVTPAAGSHRISFSLRFGPAEEAEESVITLLAAMRRLKSGNLQETAAAQKPVVQQPAAPAPAPEPSQTAQFEKYVARAKALQAEAQYREALAQLTKAVEINPGNADVMNDFTKLNFIATVVRGLPDYKTDQAQMAWHQGILAYLAGNDVKAMEMVSKAYSMQPEARNLEAFLGQLEFVTGLRRAAAPGAYVAAVNVDQVLVKLAAAMEKTNYPEAIELSKEVIKQDPNNLTAWETLGVSYFAIEDYSNWLVTWEKAYELETDPARWAQLNLRLKALGRKAEQQPAPAASEQEQPAALELRRLLDSADAAVSKGNYKEAIELSREVLAQEPANVSAWENLGISYFALGDYPKWVEAWEKTRTLEKDPKRWEALNRYLNTLRRNFAPQPKEAASQEDIQRLYNSGIDSYTAGKLDKAKAYFEKILLLDPKNEKAAKALKRVNEDLKR
ncbi:MAG TPA: tetratricopeptide repeat protein [Elusimicrobiales bacterium]|nr:tetratricopeptide repeat protein [Elusimicrobiales bacterium]